MERRLRQVVAAAGTRQTGRRGKAAQALCGGRARTRALRARASRAARTPGQLSAVQEQNSDGAPGAASMKNGQAPWSLPASAAMYADSRTYAFCRWFVRRG